MKFYLNNQTDIQEWKGKRKGVGGGEPNRPPSTFQIFLRGARIKTIPQKNYFNRTQRQQSHTQTVLCKISFLLHQSAKRKDCEAEVLIFSSQSFWAKRSSYKANWGINIGSRSTKPFLSITRSTLDQATTGLRDKFKHAGLIGKQPTRAHSSHTLTLHRRKDTQALFSPKTHLANKKRLDYFNTASRLLVSRERLGDTIRNKTITAKTRIATGVKKAVSYAGEKVRQSDTVASLRRRLAQDSQTKDMEHFEVEVETEPTNKTSYTRQPSFYAPEPEQPAQAFRTTSTSPTLNLKQKVYLETPTECLTCEKLAHCSLRSGMTTESAEQGSNVAPCRFAVKLSPNNRPNQ